MKITKKIKLQQTSNAFGVDSLHAREGMFTFSFCGDNSFVTFGNEKIEEKHIDGWKTVYKPKEHKARFNGKNYSCKGKRNLSNGRVFNWRVVFYTNTKNSDFNLGVCGKGFANLKTWIS